MLPLFYKIYFEIKEQIFSMLILNEKSKANLIPSLKPKTNSLSISSTPAVSIP